MPQAAIPIAVALGGALLTKALAPKPPKPVDAVEGTAQRAPVYDSEEARVARRRAQVLARQRSGRASTILTSTDETLGG